MLGEAERETEMAVDTVGREDSTRNIKTNCKKSMTRSKVKITPDIHRMNEENNNSLPALVMSGDRAERISRILIELCIRVSHRECK